MSFYKLKAYIAYLRKAKGRHGVHSPFVYSFIEQVLNDRRHLPFDKKLEACLGKENLVWMDGENEEQGVGNFNSWPISEQRILVFKHIHQTKAAAERWKKIYSSDKVKLSIDLFDIGLVFFRCEFKEKQHFILKK